MTRAGGHDAPTRHFPCFGRPRQGRGARHQGWGGITYGSSSLYGLFAVSRPWVLGRRGGGRLCLHHVCAIMKSLLLAIMGFTRFPLRTECVRSRRGCCSRKPDDFGQGVLAQMPKKGIP